MLLSFGLRAAEALTMLLPVRAQYALADLAGDAWYRAAPARRRLVAANLARVCGLESSSSRPRVRLRSMVREAFRQHARYYLELLRAPRYPLAHIDRHVSVPQWPLFEPLFRAGAVVLASAHLGNFEPMGIYLAREGLRAIAPVEEIQPRELYEFILKRRGGDSAGLEVVPLSKARRPLVEALRAGRPVAIIADRDLDRSGEPVTFFGHPTTMPAGPATLALLAGAPLITGRSPRTGPDRFEIRGDRIEYEFSGDRSRDVAALTAAVTAQLELYIREAPEQWFGAFQQIWPDIAASPAAESASAATAASAT